jgi:hypothetical protein
MFARFFFHLWDWDRQLKTAKHLVALLKPQKESVIAGMQVRSMTQPGNWYDRPNPEYGPMFVQSPSTMVDFLAANWEGDRLGLESDRVHGKG